MKTVKKMVETEVNEVEISDAIEFLASKGALTKYIRNVVKDKEFFIDTASKPLFEDILVGTRAATLVGGHFFWFKGTTEGDINYWAQIDRDWIAFLETNNIDPESSYFTV